MHCIVSDALDALFRAARSHARLARQPWPDEAPPAFDEACRIL